jgi:2-polyprenyl-6-methoxyphenol hydroxylase-like FAD-dependent oxidoreductase
VAVERDGHGATVIVRDVETGAIREIRVRYLIAADGAHSRVRSELGIAMRGPDRLAEAASAVFHAPLWELLGDRRYGIYDIGHPDAGGVLLPAGPGDRWLYGVVWQPGVRNGAEFTPERFAELIATAAGDEGLGARVDRTGLFTFAAQLAERFRDGTRSWSATRRTGSPPAVAPA